MRLTHKLRRAAQRYLDLQDRRTHPTGDTDTGGRWHPAQPLPCCGAIRTPSRAWPWSLMTHCRTLTHVAQESGYPLPTLRAAVLRVGDEFWADNGINTGTSPRIVVLPDDI